MSTPIPLLDLKAQHESIRGEVAQAISRVVESQHFIMGPEVDAFERDIATFASVKHAIGLTSGTDAILVALMALGIGPGDEVVTTPYTFVATCSCIARLGARAVFVDIDPRSYNIDARALAAAVGPRTKAIMPVHLFGQLADMPEIMRIAGKAGVSVIEDSAQSLGSSLDGVHAGARGAAGTYSFFPSKNLGAFGDAGMVVTNDDALATKMRLIRSQGQQPKYFSVELGGNFRIDALQAAILRAKLPHLTAWTDARRRNAERYRALFAQADLPVQLPTELPGQHHVYNQFVIRVGASERDRLREHLVKERIGSEVYYPLPMHLQECFRSWGGREGQFPESETAAKETLAIPVYPELTADMQARIVDTIRAFYRGR